MIKRFFAVVTLTFIAFSCSKDNGNMIVKGQIKGLKKGTLYLQKLVDTALVSVDSVTVFGENTFILSDDVTSPVMYYLMFDDTKDKKLMFFGEPGEITINDNIEEFGFKPKITGSKNQEVMDKFNEVNQKFKLQRLDFIAKDIESRAKKDTAEIVRLEKDYKKLVRRRFLYTTNFAVTNNDFEAAPYIALAELFDANVYLLDTINNSLTDKVKKSFYGKQLDTYIKDIKKSSEKKK